MIVDAMKHIAALGDPEKTVNSDDDLHVVLCNVELAPCAVAMESPRFTFETLAGRGWLVRLRFERPDRDTGEVRTGTSRAEFVAKGATESSVVKTAWLLLELTTRHELMEGFLYNGARIFDPHHTVDALALPSRIAKAVGDKEAARNSGRTAVDVGGSHARPDATLQAGLQRMLAGETVTFTFPAPAPATTHRRRSAVDFAQGLLATTGDWLWEGQRDVLAAIDAHPLVAARCGHKTGRTFIGAMAALWWASEPKHWAIFISARGTRAAQAIAWPALVNLARRLPPTMECRYASPLNQVLEFAQCLRGPTESGVIVTNPERDWLAEQDARNLLIVVDDAEQLEQSFAAIIDLARQGARVLFLGLALGRGDTPDDHFAEVNHQILGHASCAACDLGCFNLVHLDGERCPGARSDEVDGIQGLSTPEWRAEMAAQHGRNSVIYQNRVRGEFSGR